MVVNRENFLVFFIKMYNCINYYVRDLSGTAVIKSIGSTHGTVGKTHEPPIPAVPRPSSRRRGLKGSIHYIMV